MNRDRNKRIKLLYSVYLDILYKGEIKNETRKLN